MLKNQNGIYIKPEFVAIGPNTLGWFFKCQEGLSYVFKSIEMPKYPKIMNKTINGKLWRLRKIRNLNLKETLSMTKALLQSRNVCHLHFTSPLSVVYISPTDGAIVTSRSQVDFLPRLIRMFTNYDAVSSTTFDSLAKQKNSSRLTLDKRVGNNL